jgi:hypothetical protein
LEFVLEYIIRHEIDEVDVLDVAVHFEEGGDFTVLHDTYIDGHGSFYFGELFVFAFDELGRLEHLIDFFGDGCGYFLFIV